MNAMIRSVPTFCECADARITENPSALRCIARRGGRGPEIEVEVGGERRQQAACPGRRRRPAGGGHPARAAPARLMRSHGSTQAGRTERREPEEGIGPLELPRRVLGPALVLEHEDAVTGDVPGANPRATRRRRPRTTASVWTSRARPGGVSAVVGEAGAEALHGVSKEQEHVCVGRRLRQQGGYPRLVQVVRRPLARDP